MWHINTQKYLRVWFSQESHIFLDIENQYRLVGIRQLHEAADFTFIYSSVCLSNKANRELTFFCQQNNINSINFDTDIRQMLEHRFDVKLYEYIQKELSLFCHGSNKDLFAAMQCVPLILPVSEKFGIFSNFQSSIDFRHVPKIMKVLAPILLPHENISKMGVITDPNVNNNLLMMAIDEDNPDILCVEATNTMRQLQEQLINTYSQNNDLSISLSKIGFLRQKPQDKIEIVHEITNDHHHCITHAIKSNLIDHINLPDNFPLIYHDDI
ncbi:glycosyltransferase family 88 protein [Candidatus Berkiella aquae]|uniref:Lgt1 glycosyltransferase domain-containing protein n=1 Tax=Candidatus Berkiella aquae TaxID=295108 RepID=A0A0Q9YUL0_9GAMM|nr:glycosyltransferase family 88 protein [Candidatus Berkiella aquae]MCS5710797.1 hypothetical protein [Candidatus Berkiella aquae]